MGNFFRDLKDWFGGPNGNDTPAQWSPDPYQVEWDPNTAMPNLQGNPIGSPEHLLRYQWRADQLTEQRRNQLYEMGRGAITNATNRGLGLFESYRPGGAAALASGLFQFQGSGLANLYGNQAANLQSPDMLSDMRRDAAAKAAMAQEKAKKMAVAGTAVSAIGVAAAPFTGGASLALVGVGQGLQQAGSQQGAAAQQQLQSAQASFTPQDQGSAVQMPVDQLGPVQEGPPPLAGSGPLQVGQSRVQQAPGGSVRPMGGGGAAGTAQAGLAPEQGGGGPQQQQQGAMAAPPPAPGYGADGAFGNNSLARTTAPMSETAQRVALRAVAADPMSKQTTDYLYYGSLAFLQRAAAYAAG